jgi:2-phospho-L-lactate/phosphoenolpyruvate guanylyltransferase
MPVRIRAIVPTKPLDASKSRLAGQLSQDRRARLALAMLWHVLQAARSTSGISEVAVIGGDNAIRELCRRLQLPWEPEPALGLNACVEHAFRAARQAGWDASIYLPADLPELAPGDLACLLRLSGSGRDLVAAPDRSEQGTNALLVPSDLSFTPMLGADSFQKHLAQARALNKPVQICRSEGLLLDIDTVSDLNLLLARRPEWWREAEEILDAMGLLTGLGNHL